MTNKEKLKQLSSGDDATWLKDAEQDLERTGAQENSWRLALRVLALLREKGMSQTELAEKMGVARQRVTTIVKGQENLTFETVDRLERALGAKLMTIAEPKKEAWQFQPAAAVKMDYPGGNQGSYIKTTLVYSHANDLHLRLDLNPIDYMTPLPRKHSIGCRTLLRVKEAQRPKYSILTFNQTSPEKPLTIVERFQQEGGMLIKKDKGGLEYHWSENRF